MSPFNAGPPAEVPQPQAAKGCTNARRRSWFQFLFQFSLRSLLIATALVALGCWWYLQPETKDESLGSGELRLRRQVRTIALPEPEEQDLAPASSEPKVRLISDGSYRIVDLEDQVLVDGRMVEDRRSGWWTTYHASGRKAVEGKVARGERTGRWKTWYASGELSSEVTYVPLSQVDSDLRWKPQAWAWPASIREGIARAWYSNGQPKLEGNYASDARDGVWSYFDEQGQLLERGPYVADRREGAWTVRDTKSGRMATRLYVAGRTKEEHDRLIASMAAELQSSDRRLQLNATRKLEELGAPGTALLRQAFREGDETTQLLALRSLLRMREIDADLLPLLRPLTEHRQPALAQRAQLATLVALHRQGNFDDRLFDRLLGEIDQAGPSERRIETLQALSQLETPRQADVFQRLVAAVAQPASESNLQVGFGNSGGLDESGRVVRLDVTPLLTVKGDLPALLVRAFASSDRFVRATVLLTAERLVERGTPDREYQDPKTLYQTATWRIPADLHLLVEQGKSDPAEVVRTRAEQIGKEFSVTGGSCCFGGGGMSGGGGGFSASSPF